MTLKHVLFAAAAATIAFIAPASASPASQLSLLPASTTQASMIELAQYRGDRGRGHDRERVCRRARSECSRFRPGSERFRVCMRRHGC